MTKSNGAFTYQNGVDLQKHYDEIIGLLEKSLADKIAASEKLMLEKTSSIEKLSVEKDRAISLAEKNAENWRADANEWRGAMNDKDKRYALKEHTDKVEQMVLALISEKKGGKDLWGWIVGAISFAIMLFTLASKFPAK